MNEPELMSETLDEEVRRETYEVLAGWEGTRLDKFLSEVTELTRSAAVRLTEEGAVFLEVLQGGVWKPLSAGKNTKLPKNCRVTVTYPEPEDSEALPENIPLDIIYEDEDVLVINKPAGMVVHPAPGNYTGTLVNALLHHCGDSLSGVGGVRRPGIVHRIDKDTSGLLVVAKHDAAHNILSAQLKTHTVSRVYYAICLGNIKEDCGTVDLPIGRNPNDRKKMAVFPKGSVSEGKTGTAAIREAVTHYTVLKRFSVGHKWGQSFTLVKCELETGRTHQIRVHMAAQGHPLLGDSVYGGDSTRFEKYHPTLIHGQCLHAGELKFIHPRTGREVQFTCPLPSDFEALVAVLGKEADYA
ncbi:MAG: RluA family pseudouridine synthase [Ruminococcaceae bacterium]|nr:RluA family pseudouridine synthase [Oscillospiraceae bacterium]